MRLILTLLFFTCSNLFFAQETLIKFSFTDNLRIGYGVEMYFIVEDFSKIESNISKLDSISEWKILKLFGIPLIDLAGDYEGCELGNTILRENSDFIRHKKKIVIDNGNNTFELSFSSARLDYCTFKLRYKYWSYFVCFDEAAVVTNYNSAERLSKSDKIKINEIERLLRKKLESLAS